MPPHDRLSLLALSSTLLVACTGSGSDGSGSGSGSATGDEGGNPDAPRFSAAALADGDTISLTFTEALAAPDGVQPALFRLSLGVFAENSTTYYALAFDFGYGTTGYGDTGYGGTGYATGYGDTGYTTYPAHVDHPRRLARPIPTPLAIDDIGVSAVHAGADATRVELDLASDLAGSRACMALAESRAAGEKSGLFVHYRSAANGLQDPDGNTVGSLAQHWVDADAQSYVDIAGDFPNMDPYLPIDCP